MKKYFIIVIAAVALMSAGQQDSAITKENGSVIVNTTTIAKNVEGYDGAVPVKIYIKKNKIETQESGDTEVSGYGEEESAECLGRSDHQGG